MSTINKLEIAKMIDHSLLHPTMDDKSLRDGIELARRYSVATVCIKPYAVQMAAELLKGSDVMVCTMIAVTKKHAEAFGSGSTGESCRRCANPGGYSESQGAWCNQDRCNSHRSHYPGR